VRGCYAFLLYGNATESLFINTATAMLSLLKPCRTTQRVVLLLTEPWWGTRYEALFASLGVHIRRTPQLQHVGCGGPFRKGSHFVGTYTAFAAWGLVDLCDSVVYMDSDLQVVRNMDHLFDFMTKRPDVVTAGVQLNWPEMNTGVWLLRPNKTIHDSLISYTHTPGPPGYPCGKGFQLAAKSFFGSHVGKPRWFTRFSNRYNCMSRNEDCYKRCAECDPDLESPYLDHVYVVHWPGELKPDSPLLWNASSQSPTSFIHYAPYKLHEPMHPLHANGLRQWHAHRRASEHVLHSGHVLSSYLGIGHACRVGGDVELP